ncbi:hypothetical protein IGI37_002737 [Enterococcus sp. AZ194]|uniref:DUF3916 domain-containing protein n=1 Tax=Enterococcus sp. AZ194 TaxID=2774629 RepID=UPI003F1EDD78
MRAKKVRGIRRKLNKMFYHVAKYTAEFPTINGDYWHLYLPTTYNFINSPKLPNKVKIQCIQLLINKAQQLSELKPIDQETYRVVVAITLNHLWSSQIILFKGDNYFNVFFDRNDNYQKWSPLPGHKKFELQENLFVPENFSVLGYKETLSYEGAPNIISYTGDIWFIGNLT